jgi:3-hydroxyisobutyrate dehydrogenase
MGLGLMGAGMARRLLAAGFPVTAYNRTRAKAEAIGAKVANSPREAAAGADVVISMLPDETASREAWLGEGGALAGARSGAVLIESGTQPITWVKELAAAAGARGCAFIDAPVTGSRPAAESGELLFLAGGDAAAVDSVRDVLAPMSRGVAYMGPTGSGALMKLINNFMTGVQVASLAEALALIDRGGLDRDRALEILGNGAPGSPMIRGLGPRMASGDDTMNFALRWMLKDVTYAIGAATTRGVHLRSAEAAAASIREAVQKGLGDRDLAALYEVYKQ